jgi:hypothetical protein
MPVSKNHKKGTSHKEWKSKQNKKKFNAVRVEKQAKLKDQIDKFHARRMNNPLLNKEKKETSKGTFTSRMLKKFGLNKGRRNKV